MVVNRIREVLVPFGWPASQKRTDHIYIIINQILESICLAEDPCSINIHIHITKTTLTDAMDVL